MKRSALCDAPGFARDIETALRKMWQAWCRQSGDGSGSKPSDTATPKGGALNDPWARDRRCEPLSNPDHEDMTPMPEEAIPSELKKAIAYHRSAKIEAAEAIYRAILETDPQRKRSGIDSAGNPI
jgi:hypothetical protein